MGIFHKLVTITYPWWVKLSGGKRRLPEGKAGTLPPPVSFYSLHAVSNTGEDISFDRFKDKKVLLVNLASRCGYTPQYAALEAWYRSNPDVVVLGFPANNFGAQEPGSDSEIAAFCRLQYDVSFPIFKKGDVIGEHQQPVYRWLTDPAKNGWNRAAPQWNFYKYLVDERGVLIGQYSSAVLPMSIL